MAFCILNLVSYNLATVACLFQEGGRFVVGVVFFSLVPWIVQL